MKFNKIADFERMVLHSVNEHLKKDSLYLHGLSDKAIEEWFTRNSEKTKLKNYLLKLNKSLQEKKISNSYTLLRAESLPPIDKIQEEINLIFAKT